MTVNVQITELRGSLTNADYRRLERALEDGGTYQVTNVERLEFLCASAFGLLVRSRGRLASEGGELAVSGCSSWLAHTLRVLGLDGEFKFFASDDEKRVSEGSGGPPTERGGGDEVAEPKRRRRAASAGFVPAGKPRRTAKTRKSESSRLENFTGEQRLLLLDCWFRSKLPATEFSPLVGVTSATLYAWRRKFEDEGPAGLMGHKRGMKGSQLPEPTKRAIPMMKEAHPDWGQDRIHDMLIRSEGLEASAGAVRRVLTEEG